MDVVRRGAVAIINTAVILAVVAVPPWALLHFAGNPFPRAVEEIGRLTVEPLTLRQLAPFLTIVLWAVWLLLLSSLAIEVIARTRGISPFDCGCCGRSRAWPRPWSQARPPHCSPQQPPLSPQAYTSANQPTPWP